MLLTGSLFFIIGGLFGGYFICLALTYGLLRGSNLPHTSFSYFVTVYGLATALMLIIAFSFSWSIVSIIIFTFVGGLGLGTLNYFIIRAFVRVDPQPSPSLIEAAEGDPTETTEE